MDTWACRPKGLILIYKMGIKNSCTCHTTVCRSKWKIHSVKNSRLSSGEEAFTVFLLKFNMNSWLIQVWVWWVGRLLYWDHTKTWSSVQERWSTYALMNWEKSNSFNTSKSVKAASIVDLKEFFIAWYSLLINAQPSLEICSCLKVADKINMYSTDRFPYNWKMVTPCDL